MCPCASSLSSWLGSSVDITGLLDKDDWGCYREFMLVDWPKILRELWAFKARYHVRV